MISFSTFTSNPDGNVIIKEKRNSDLYTQPSRVSRVKTLDGASVITHSGTIDGDRTLRIKALISREQAEKIRNIDMNETFIFVSFSDGLFIGAIEDQQTNNGELNMVFLIQDREA